ncbi:MAG: sugar transferase, partial [Clostridia bacterium]|nr:sugar transferase [Clostridia bacterium]
MLDVSAAAAGSVAACPVILGAMAVIRLNSPESPVIFKQKRIGYMGREFTIYKLRTMTDERDADGNLLPDESRLRNWGRAIRKLSIDELPQMVNILKGEMSWIGPRPLLPREMLVMTDSEQAERQSVLPGITGWEAVNE